MSTQEPARGQAGRGLTPLPRLEELPVAEHGYDRARVHEAFEAFRRHVTALQAQLRVLQAAPRAAAEPTGHAVRMDALHIVRAAAEFADAIERDAQEAAAKQIGLAEQEIRGRQLKLQEREAEVARIRQETERQRAEILNGARNEAREILTQANREATREVREAEARAARLVEQSRHQATELTNAARAEVEQTVEWARSHAETITERARGGAEQLLAAAAHGDAAIRGAVDAIVRAAEAAAGPRERASRERETQPPSERALPRRGAEAVPAAPSPRESERAGTEPARGARRERAGEEAEGSGEERERDS